MTPERTAALVARWVRLYTRDLPEPVAERRVSEIDADLHDHIEHERAGGTGERRIALAVASRMLRGLAADAAWRRRQAKAAARLSNKEGTMNRRTTLYRSAVRVALGVALLLSVALVGNLLSDEMVWSLGDFVAAGVLLTIIGVAVELAVRRWGNLFVAAGIAVLGVAAAVVGEADDAPGLVLIGLVLVATACAIGVRRVQQSR